MYILLFLWVLPARTSLSLAMFPQEKLYVLSLAHQGPTSLWDGQVTLAAPGELTILLPSRFMIGKGDVSLSMGYAGFWQEYASLPLLAREQALLFQAKNQGFVLLLPRASKKQAIGYEHSMGMGKLAVLAWMQPSVEASSFQTMWGTDSSRWGVVAKVFLSSSLLELSSELLFSPVQGLQGYVSSSYKYGSSKLLIAYGQEIYPCRYTLALDLAAASCSISFVMEDWVGPKPIYGGFSAMRRRRQSSSLRFFLGSGYLLFSFSDTYVFTQRGLEVSSVMMQATWKGPFGQVSAKYGGSRHLSDLGDGEYRLSLILYKASLSYTEAGYEITLSDSVAIGKGIGTWKLKKSMGKSVSLSLMYAVTSDR